jgi:hypothetical protein
MPVFQEAFTGRLTPFPALFGWLVDQYILPWGWQLGCSPKRWTTLNIKLGSHPIAEVLHWTRVLFLTPIRLHPESHFKPSWFWDHH